MDNHHYILQVALHTSLRKTFDYLLPTNINIEKLKIGMRIRVSFNNQPAIGILLKITHNCTPPKEKLEYMIEILDSEPLLNLATLSLYTFASHYYQHPIGEIIFSNLPSSLCKGAQPCILEENIYTLTELGANTTNVELKHAVQQQKIVHLLKMHPNGLSRHEIIKAKGQPKALTALLAKGFVRKHVRRQSPLPPTKTASTYHYLNEHQHDAVTAMLNQQGFVSFLLEGRADSGNIEVYLYCIENILKKKKQALILLPEIDLTPQTIAKFQSRFSVPISVLRSNLSKKERDCALLFSLRGIARIIIGTPAAVLTPLPELGIIILDEAHNLTKDEHAGFSYSAKDMAVMRSKLESIPLLLSTTTPT
jgi:primosomal protein N' (replication factor Y) (superfamily II helicase)